jgi:UPF0755 protein
MRLLRNLLIPAILGLVLLVVVFVAFVFIRYSRHPQLNPFEAFALNLSLALRSADLDRPAGDDSSSVCFTISQGDTAGTIANKLVGQGFKIDTELFRNYVRYHGIDANLQAGTFLLRRNFTIPNIAYKLTDAKADAITFLVREGLRREEIAALIDSTPGLTFNGADFLALTGQGVSSTPGRIADYAAHIGLPPGRTLEGFLFPDTYALPACASAEELAWRMLQNFEGRVTPQMRADAQAKGFSLYQAITLASIVERETSLDEERPIIAGVYLNRYRNSQKSPPDANVPITLDADPTIQYALGDTRSPAEWWPPLTQQDYRGVNSPYNTYLFPGLPPGPIDNPGLASIRAAIYPQESSYVYFRACAGEGGRHRFSLTFAEHTAACP